MGADGVASAVRKAHSQRASTPDCIHASTFLLRYLTYLSLCACMYARMDGWMDGWKDGGWVGGCIDGSLSALAGWMGGWCTNICTLVAGYLGR